MLELGIKEEKEGKSSNTGVGMNEWIEMKL
jgi:hypothetical protein